MLKTLINVSVFIYIIVLALSACNKSFHLNSEHLFEGAVVHKVLTVQGPEGIGIPEATAYWNEFLGKEAIQTNAGKFPVYITLKDEFKSDYNFAHGLSSTYPTHCSVEIKKLDIEASRRVLIHEIGHCIGFNHSTNPKSVMYPYVLKGQIITDEMLEIIKKAP